ncbi:sensor histidine kinase [Pseudophaeobacter sp.]|uniref:sensor histidine kinase n=1 Tax=Pseudophaeobacter sp. TaxID=1971739 RepID=UPI0040589B45
MRPRLVQKWRPTLALVLGGGLLGTLILSLIGLVALRYLGPEIGFRNAAAILAALILLATACLGVLLVRLLITPIRNLQTYAAKMREDPSQNTDIPYHSGTKELHHMARSVVEMADHLRNREITIRSFTDHVSHEIKTPVSAIRAAAELIEDGEGLPPQDQQLLQQILGATQQIETQLAALRDVARAREIRHHGKSTLGSQRPWLKETFPDLDIMLTGEDHPIPLADAGLRILLTHLQSNAREHGAKSVTLTVVQQPTEVTLEISDDGSGISAGNARQIFDPFFTTKRGKGGTGMGLAILRNMLGVHGAQITLQPSSQGASFLVRFAL